MLKSFYIFRNLFVQKPTFVRHESPRQGTSVQGTAFMQCCKFRMIYSGCEFRVRIQEKFWIQLDLNPTPFIVNMLENFMKISYNQSKRKIYRLLITFKEHSTVFSVQLEPKSSKIWILYPIFLHFSRSIVKQIIPDTRISSGSYIGSEFTTLPSWLNTAPDLSLHKMILGSLRVSVQYCKNFCVKEVATFFF